MLTKKTGKSTSVSLSQDDYDGLSPDKGPGYWDILEIRSMSNVLIHRFTREQYRSRLRWNKAQLLEARDEPGATPYWVVNIIFF